MTLKGLDKYRSFYTNNRILGRKISGSLILLTIAAICQFAGDFLFTKFLSPQDIASYFNFRSYFLIFSSFVLVGNGTSIVREKTLDRRYVVICSSLQNFALSIITTVIYCFFFLKQPDYFIYYLLGLIVYSHTRVIFAIKQSEKKINSSIYYSEFWRVILLVLFLAFYAFNGHKVTFPYLVMITIISFYAVIFDLVKSVFLLFRSSINVLFDRDNFKKLYGFGYLFFIFGLTLNASIFIDQLIVTTYLDPKISANYIAHITLFMSPLLFLNKFMTSFAAPYLRDDHKGIVSGIRKKLPLVIWGFVLLMILCYVASYVGFKVFYAKKYELVLSLTFFIWFTGILRILYIFPSAIVGMRGTKSELHSFLTGNVVGLLVQVVLSAIGIYYFKAEALLFVIWAMLINWIIRLFSGFSNIVKIMRR